MTTIFNLLTPVQKNLLQLLQHGLWGKSIEPKLFEDLSAEDWKKIVELAAIQGILALAFDGIKGLAEELRPPKNILIQWGLGVKQIESRYHQHVNALQSLTALYRNNDIRCLVLKGLSVSRFYPIPEHRESGDLDIFLLGDYARGNHIMEKMGIEVSYECSVHSKFEFLKVPVENHASFFSLDWHQADRDFEALLHQELKKKSLEYAKDLNAYFPRLSFNLLLLYKHAIKHFIITGIVLRHLCDLALLMNLSSEEEYFAFYETMKKHDLDRYVDAFNFIIAQYLGVPMKEQVNNPDERFIRKVSDDIFHQVKLHPVSTDRNLFQLLKAKVTGTFFIIRSKWKYKAINKEMFRQELIFRMNFGLKQFKGVRF